LLLLLLLMSLYPAVNDCSSVCRCRADPASVDDDDDGDDHGDGDDTKFRDGKDTDAGTTRACRRGQSAPRPHPTTKPPVASPTRTHKSTNGITKEDTILPDWVWELGKIG
jgi:hypothetical protein